MRCIIRATAITDAFHEDLFMSREDCKGNLASIALCPLHHQIVVVQVGVLT